jgi:hypothetical protein
LTAGGRLTYLSIAATNRNDCRRTADTTPPGETTKLAIGIRAGGDCCSLLGGALLEPTIPLDTIYTADEAAERLRLTNRGVIKLAKQYGLCSRIGRDYLFSEADLLAIWQAIREPAKVPRLPTVKAPLSDLRLYESLQKLSAKKKGPGRKRWEATNTKNRSERDATKAGLEKWKDDEPLDRTNRDPEYWTPERKERRQLESLAKKKGWLART